jgi:MoaA/NifB/PqqE/SkfB family radical SAM enzyme
VISLIIPCWNDRENAIALAQQWADHPLIREVIIASVDDGRPVEPSLLAAASNHPKVRECSTAQPGRGPQMNQAARLATGETLLFHHVDSVLTDLHLRALANGFAHSSCVGGGFYRKFDERHPWLRLFEFFERWHSCAFGTIYGDQSIFVRRHHFERMGGFAPIPLMEDVEFSRRLRHGGRIALLDPPMQTSPRKHLEHGPWKVTTQNLLFLILFWLGVSPVRLHRWYYSDAAANPWRARWNAFRHPVSPEKTEALRKRWNSLPRELQVPNQASGRHLTHCAFISGPSYCSFHCTHCYLPENANRVPIPSLAEIKEQIDANRRFQGPGGGLQITGGDVADAYWKSGRASELIEIIRYTYSVGLIPMLMTHGQTLLEHPEFLERLVVEGGLRQISVHIDVTQAGRHGYPIGRIKSEADLYPVREAFTELARRIREKTGLPLEYALTVTVTEKNLSDIPDLIRWYLSDPKRTHIWRMLSFQPEADTGRTIFSKRRATSEAVWDKICKGTGIKVDRNWSIFGHPDCNNWYSLLVSRISGRYIVFPAQDLTTRKLFNDILAIVGGISFVRDDAGTTPYRVAGALVQHPWLAIRIIGHAVRLIATGQVPFEFIRAILTGCAHTVGTGTHNFMDAAQVARAEHDPVVRARLDSCVFKGAVKRNGNWEMVPMCAMNESKWSAVYKERLRDPALAREQQVSSTETPDS